MSRLDLPSRPRRNRVSPAIRGMVRETRLDPADLVLPVFVHDGVGREPIASMPGQHRHDLAGLLDHVAEAASVGVRGVVLFPKVDDSRKTADGRAAYDDDGLVPRCLRALAEAHPDVARFTDVALDPYSTEGHDGLVADDGTILNDETVEVLCRQAVCQARAGADVVAPSDMMDGRVGAIRRALDAEGFTSVGILSYAAKYASAFYGPFRGALDSAPKSGDKQTYQMDPANAREALREVDLDELEGADVVMVKPAGPYLDIVRAVRERTTLPVAAYQVSGEYLMLEAASAGGWLDRRAVIMESLLGIRRAGADLIFTYYAIEAARWLGEPR